MKAARASLKVENAALRDQIRDLKENLKAGESREAYWANEVGRLRSKMARIRDLVEGRPL